MYPTAQLASSDLLAFPSMLKKGIAHSHAICPPMTSHLQRRMYASRIKTPIRTLSMSW
jgi:hypothetical protein